MTKNHVETWASDASETGESFRENLIKIIRLLMNNCFSLKNAVDVVDAPWNNSSSSGAPHTHIVRRN